MHGDPTELVIHQFTLAGVSTGCLSRPSAGLRDRPVSDGAVGHVYGMIQCLDTLTL